MSSFFPYVPISASSTAETLNSQKPMLLLAILMSASWRDGPLQLDLNEQYHLELAHRTIVRPRKTIGLIQSILIHLAWYHFYFTPQSQQLQSLLQLAIGLATDMGIYQNSKKPLIDISGFSKPTTISASDLFPVHLRKPNLFEHTQGCAARLGSDLEYPSDAILMQMTTLRCIDDQVYEKFLSDDSHDVINSDIRFQMHVRLVESQMKAQENQTIDELEYRVM
ncbi:hypothetical protein GQ44DRAFT_724391 [Phaeosphaeriaceae sp. PMI808]|nr:hypothetical protein GQ44DRAFT_724391 [Phaeosphaeriaceae sp. PMI808]